MDPERPLGKEGETAIESQPTPTAEQIQYEHEKEAFKTHMATSGEQVPENFKDAGAYFDSLKEAQKQYTQTRQELSELRNSMEQQPEQPIVTPEAEALITNELRIPAPEEKKEETKAETLGVDETTYEKWGYEFATQGDLSPETREEIKKTTGFTDRMVSDYIAGQKAKLREGFDKAATVVGGRDNLNKLFKWASNNLNKEQMENINLGLSSPTYEVTLRGLNEMYKEQVTKEKQKEPAPNPNLTQVAASQTGILPFNSQVEFKEARSNPQFQFDPKYRDVVQKRMAITDWNTLPLV